MEKLMDYNKLKTFVITADYGSITAAADHLRRSQSAITQQIQALEEELETQLFERKAGRIFLSADGEKIHAYAKQKLGALDDYVGSLRQESKSVEGHLSIGVLNDSGTDFDIGKAVGGFCQKYSKVRVSIHVGDTDFVENGLIDNNFDLGVFVFFKKPEMFIKKPVKTNHHHLYTSKKYLDAHGPIKSYKDLVQKDLIDIHKDFLGLSTFIRKNAKEYLATLKHREPNIVCPNIAMIHSMILEGHGIAMLPNFLVEKDLKSGRLVKLFKSAKSLTGGLDVAYRTNRTLRLCERLFVEHVSS